MYISKVLVENFRSIERAEFTTSEFVVLIGQNNAGKTNFFEAIEWFYNGAGKGQSLDDLKFFRKSDRKIRVELQYSGAQHGLAKMENDKNRETIRKAIGENDLVSVVRDSDDPKKRFFVINGEARPTGTGFDPALNDFLPKFEYVSTKQYHTDVAKYGKSTPITIMLSGLLTEIMKSNPQYKDFIEKFDLLFQSGDSQVSIKMDELAGRVKFFLEKQFPDTTRVEFSVTPPEFDDLLKTFETGVDDGVMTTADEKGDGMQRALMLAIIQTYAEYRRSTDASCKSFLFFIDEAELHLHPKAQRKLKTVLHELSTSGDQVFINTHSSVLISDNEANQRIFSVEKYEGRTTIEQVPDSGKHAVVFDLLGGSPNDLLFPANILIVEGPSEVEFISKVISTHYAEKPRIQVIPARGDAHQVTRLIDILQKNYDTINNAIYRERFVILIDRQPGTAENAVKDFLNKNPDVRKGDRLVHRQLN